MVQIIWGMPKIVQVHLQMGTIEANNRRSTWALSSTVKPKREWYLNTTTELECPRSSTFVCIRTGTYEKSTWIQLQSWSARGQVHLSVFVLVLIKKVLEYNYRVGVTHTCTHTRVHFSVLEYILLVLIKTYSTTSLVSLSPSTPQPTSSILDTVAPCCFTVSNCWSSNSSCLSSLGCLPEVSCNTERTELFILHDYCMFSTIQSCAYYILNTDGICYRALTQGITALNIITPAQSGA